MTADEHVRLVRESWAALERGDLAAAMSAFAPDLEWDVSRDIWGAVVGGGVYRGMDGLATWMSDFYSAWERFEMRAEEVFEVGDGQVVAVMHARGLGRASGVEVEHRPAGVSTMRDGKVARVVWFASRDEALAVIGHTG